PRRFQPELEIIHNRDEPLEQILVCVLDRVVFLSRAPLLVILKVGLAAHGEVAKPIEIGLQTSHWIFGLGLVNRRRDRGRRFGRRCRSFLWVVGFIRVFEFGYRNLFHVLRMAIKVMSSFCGCEPTKFRKSSIKRVTIAEAPFIALARTDSIVRSMPNSSPSAS